MSRATRQEPPPSQRWFLASVLVDRSTMAAQLTQRWNQPLWERVSQVVVRGVPEVSEAPVSRAGERQVLRRHLTSQQASDIVASYLGGKTVYALAVEHKVDDKTIIKRLVDADVELRAAKHGLPDSELETIVGLRAAGWTLNQIGEHYERSGTAIRKYLLRHDALEAHAAR